jgi:sulfonate transport system ATP-binding protein
LVRQPDLLLLDEPFASLDALTRLKMQQLVRELCLKHSPATLLVTHDVDEAIVLADRILVLSHGRISFDKAVNMPHPRHAASHAFATLRDTLLSELGIEAVL